MAKGYGKYDNEYKVGVVGKMISAEQIASFIESGLNSNADLFRLKANVGDFEKALRDENSNNMIEYVNGILKLGDADRMAIKGLQAYTQSAQVEFIIDLEKLDKVQADENNPYNEDYPQVHLIESIITQYIQSNNANSFNLTDSGGVSYEITTNYGGVQVGTPELISPLGHCVSVYFYATLTIVESGINTNNVEWYINNERIIIQNYSCTRKREIESVIAYGTDVNHSIAQSNGLSVALIRPMLNNDISRLIEQDLYSGVANTCYLVTRKRGTLEKSYKMIIAENSESGEIGANIGSTIHFVEGNETLMDYGNFDIHEYPELPQFEGQLYIEVALTNTFVANKFYSIWINFNNTTINLKPFKVVANTDIDDPSGIRIAIDNNLKISLDLLIARIDIDYTDLVLGKIAEIEGE